MSVGRKLQRWGRACAALMFLLLAEHAYCDCHGKLVGSVRSVAGAPQVGARIEFEDLHLGRVADRNGEFSILAVPCGWHRVRVSQIDYSTMIFDSVLVDTGLTTVLDILMVRPSDPPHLQQIVVSTPVRPLGVEGSRVREAAEARGLDSMRMEWKRVGRWDYLNWGDTLIIPSSGIDSGLVGRGSSMMHYARAQQTAISGRENRIDARGKQAISRVQSLGFLPLGSLSTPQIADQRLQSKSPVVNETDRKFLREYHSVMIERLTRRSYDGGEVPEVERPTRWSSLRRRFWYGSSTLGWLYRDASNFVGIGLPSKRLSVSLNPVYGYEVISTDDHRGTIARFTGGMRIEGGYAQKIRFLMDFRDHTESGNGPYNSRDSLYEDRWPAVDLKGNSSTSYDISESFVQWYGRDLSLAAGRGRFYWGPAQFGSLFLNSKMPPFDYVRFDGVFESKQTDAAVYYTFLHGFLQSALPADTLYDSLYGRPRYLNREKYLSMQRLEIRPRGNFLVAMNQGVVYGDRGVQLGYVVPLNFLYSVQHANDDKDNFVLGFDGTWRPVRGLKLYSELFFDDIIVSELFKASRTNKSAHTLGLQGIVPRPIWRNFDLKAEYTKIRPFVYSHVFSTNTFTHWYSPIGYSLEPNSEYLTAELRWIWYPLYVTGHVSRQNHGANPGGENVGGDIYLPSPDDGKVPAPFLAGEFEHTDRIGLRIEWEALENLWLRGDITHITESRREDRLESRVSFGWNL